MRTPGFTAESSLYKSSWHYYVAAADTVSSNQAMLQQGHPPGLCEKASKLCRRGVGGSWCDILLECWDGCTPGCDPPRPMPAKGPCLWQRCVDEDCQVSWRPAPGCTRCVPPRVQECRDASGNCFIQNCDCIVCGNQCCSSGQQCAGGVCCPSSQVCGNRCCPSGTVCSGGACSPVSPCGTETPCGGGCCPTGFTVCCPGGKECCPAGTRCVTLPFVGGTLCLPF